MTPTGGAESAQARLESALAGIPRRGVEGSFKLAPLQVSAGRGLIGIEKRSLPRETLLDIARRLSAPAEYAEAIDADYAKANFFYFGYENDTDGDGGALKIYVEYPVYIAPLTREERSGPDASRPALQACGYKWDAIRGSPTAITRYVWYVHLGTDALSGRMEALRGGVMAPAFDLARSLVSAAGRTGKPPLYIEATEPGSSRTSFDVNVYAANLQVKSIDAHLRALGEHYAIHPDTISALLHATGSRPLGHLSAGIDRRGTDFLTIYYGL